MKIHILFLFLLLLLIVSCTQQEKEFFNGQLIYFEISDKTDTIKGEPIFLKGIATGAMSVYDSLVVFNSHKYPKQHLHIFSLNSGKYLTAICDKGEGPEDYIHFSHRGQYVKENNEIKLWVYDSQKKNTLINLTKSIRNQTTEIDSTIYMDWHKEHWMPCNSFFALNDGKFILKSQSEYNNLEWLSSHTYHLYQNTFENKIGTYELYKNIFEDEQDIYFSDQTFSSFDQLHPTYKDRIAMVMFGVPQINILDISTGELIGSRMDKFDVRKLFKSQYHFYYKGMSVSENHIYALFLDLEIDKEGKNFSACSNEVHVFDWEGNFVKKLFLEYPVEQISFNQIDKRLYGINNEEEIFCFSLD